MVVQLRIQEEKWVKKMSDFIRKIYAKINDELREVQLYVHGEVGYITLECMSKEDYECLEDIAGREVCSDELCELYPIFSNTEDLKERFDDEFD